MHILVKRRWLILSVVAASLVLTVLITLMQTPLYTSTVRLQIDRQVAKIVEGGNITPIEGPDLEFMKTQYELLEGRTMAERVASALKLGDDADFFKPRGFSLIGFREAAFGISLGAGGSSRHKATGPISSAAAAGIVPGNRAVMPVLGSRLVDISYSDPEPSRAQRVAGAYADAFIASNLDKRFQANAYAKAFLEDQLTQLKLRLEQSEKALLDFGQKEQIVQTNDEGFDCGKQSCGGERRSEYAGFGAHQKMRSLWKQLQTRQTQSICRSYFPTPSSKDCALSATRWKATIRTNCRHSSRVIRPWCELSSQIAEIDRQLAAEVQTLKGSYKAAYEFVFESRK